MALTHIEYGSLASSEVMNDNFEYLDNRVTTVANSLTSTASSINSNIASLNSSFSETTEELSSDLSDLELEVDVFRSDFDTQNEAPKYSNATSIALPYTAVSSGYVYVKVQSVNGVLSVFINENPVLYGQCSGIQIVQGGLFRVSAGDEVTITGNCQEANFYPFKYNNRTGLA